MTEKPGKPVRNKFRFGAKIIEWIAALSVVAIIVENLGFVENVSSTLAIPARKAANILPDLAEIVARIPSPNFVTDAMAGTKMAQDFNLLLNLAALWVVARLIASLFRLMGARRGKVENIFGFFIKGLILLALLSEGVKLAMGSETIDLFKGLIPLFTHNGGDAPAWLSNNNLRELAWAISSAITGLLVGVWAYRSNIRPGRLMRQEMAEYEAAEEPYAYEIPKEPELVEEPEASEVSEEPEEPEASEVSEEPEESEAPEVSEEPEESEAPEVSAEPDAPETPEEPEENH